MKPVLGVCGILLLAHNAFPATAVVTGPVKGIQVRTPSYNSEDPATYIKLDVSGAIRHYRIHPEEAKGKEILSAAIAAKASGEPMTLGYNDASCAINGNDYCLIQFVEY